MSSNPNETIAASSTQAPESQIIAASSDQASESLHPSGVIAASSDQDSESTQNSDYESGSEFSTDSLSSSIYEYRFENGRRYHAYKDGQYVLPNDEREQDRLDIMNHIYQLILDDKLYLAPIPSNPQRILDIGTGTGIWAIDIAELYPSAEVIGTDLSPIQPSWVPPNLQFQIDDAEADWTFELDSFDFIHARHLAGAIKDWPRLLWQAYRHLKPGGYIELQEVEMTLYSDDGSYDNTMLSEFYTLVNKAAGMNGRVFDVAKSIEPLLETAGYEDIFKRMIKVPVGTWPADPKQKERGAYIQMVGESGFEAIGLALLTRQLGMDPEDARKITDGAQKDTRDKKIHSYSRHFIYYGRKPELDE